MPALRVGNSLIALSTNDTPRAAFFREAYQSLRTRLLRIHETGVRVFTPTSSVMLEGKTLTALNLALVCSQLRDHRVLLVDGDLRSRGLTCLLQIDRQIGLSDTTLGEEFSRSNSARDRPGQLANSRRGNPLLADRRSLCQFQVDGIYGLGQRQVFDRAH